MARLTPTLKRDILQKVNSFISEGTAHCIPKHNRVEENGKYVRGEQWMKGDLERQKARDKPAIPINDTFKVVNAIANREMVERLVPKATGRSREDNGAAQVLDEAARWQRQMAGSEHFESMAFRSATIGGYGCMHKFWDPTSYGGDGMIRDEDVPIWEMLWPVRAREMNLTDRRWHVRGRWLDLETIDALYGDDNREVRRLVKDFRVAGAKAKGAMDVMPDPVQGRSAFGGQAGTWLGVQGGTWFNSATEEACMLEAEWREAETFFRAAIPARMAEWASFISGGTSWQLQDPQTGEPVEVLPEDFYQMMPEQRRMMEYEVLVDLEIARFDTKAELDDVMNFYSSVFGREFPESQWQRDQREVVRFALVVDNVVAEYGKRPWGFSYHFLTGFPFETRDGMDFYGAVDIIKGPQDLKNGLISNLLAMYFTSPKGGIIVEKDAGIDIQKLADQFASTGGIIEAPPGFLQSQKFLRMDPPKYPEFPAALMQLADIGVQQGLGLSAIDINTQGDLRRVSGTVVQAARTASNVVVAVLFDSLRKFRREYGRCNLMFLAKMYTPNDILRIVGDEKLEDIQTMPEDWGDVLKFDIHIDEQPVTPTEQMELLDFLTRTGELSLMRQRGDIDLEEQLELMPTLPESKKRMILNGKMKRDQLIQMQEVLGKRDQALSVLINQISGMPGGAEVLMQFQAMMEGRDAMGAVQAPPGQSAGDMVPPEMMQA